MLSTGRILGVLVFLGIIYIAIPVLITTTGLHNYWFTLASVSFLSVGSAGVWLTFYIGRINIGQGAFALFGGYVSAILITKLGWNFWLTLPASALGCAILSVLIGLPILRLRGVYFAMVTLVLTEVMRLFALAVPITNGASGITSIPLPGSVSIFGFTLIPDFSTLSNSRAAFYFFGMTLMSLTFFVVWRLVNSRLGHLCRSLQQNEELASSIGVNVAYLRVVIYAISSSLGGITGASFVAISQSIYPSTFQIKDSIDFMLNCFLGGLGYVFGSLLGTWVLYFGWDLLFLARDFQLLIYSSIIIAFMLFLPNGILSLFDKENRR